MLAALLPIFVVDTKITFVYNFVAPLNIVEIEIAGKKIIKMAQNRACAEEISSLGSANNKKVGKVKQNSKLYSLDLFFEDYQVLLVGGRLKSSSLNNSYHPILLPKNGTVTELLVKWCHGKTAHGGIVRTPPKQKGEGGSGRRGDFLKYGNKGGDKIFF